MSLRIDATTLGLLCYGNQPAFYTDAAKSVSLLSIAEAVMDTSYVPLVRVGAEHQ